MTDLAKDVNSDSGRGTLETDDDRCRGVHQRGLRPRRARQAVAKGLAAGRPRRRAARGGQLPDLRHSRRLDHRGAHRRQRISRPPQRLHAPRPPADRHTRGREERLWPRPQVVRLRLPRLDLRPGRGVHSHPRTTGLAGSADPRQHPPSAGQSRHLGRLVVDQHGPRLRAAGRLPVSRREDPRPVRPGEHALQMAQVAVLRLQLEGRAGGLQRDLPRLHDASGVQQVRRIQGLGQGARQTQQHRL